ncbi:MAG: hypothetical protein V1752_04900 [Candidatus Firestonebacteria bacterium]
MIITRSSVFLNKEKAKEAEIPYDGYFRDFVVARFIGRLKNAQ